jgi:hypothetical protein
VGVWDVVLREIDGKGLMVSAKNNRAFTRSEIFFERVVIDVKCIF